MTQHGHAEQGKVTEGIEEFVAYELVFKTQPLFVEDAVFVDDNGVFQGTALGQAVAFHIFDLMQESEGPGRGDLPGEGLVCQLKAIFLVSDGRIFKGDD